MRRALALAALVLAAGGCGGEQSPGARALNDTADRLGEIRSGELTFHLLVVPADGDEGEAVGFELEGPFALASEDAPAVADIRYTRRLGGDDASVAVVLADGRGFVRTNGTYYELPDDVAASLVATGGSEADDPLDGLALENWLTDEKVTSAGDTDRVTGTVDVVAAVNDLLELARDLGREDLDAIEGDDADRLRDAVRRSSLTLVTGADDRFLRDLRLDVDLGADVPEELQEALGGAVGARVSFRLAIANPNAPVEVEAPESARPYEELNDS